MKKLLTAIVLSAFSISGVFAIGISAGAGPSVSSTSWSSAASAPGVTFDGQAVIVPFGAKVFFDATYVQVSAGFITATAATDSATGYTTTTYHNDLSYLTFAALGKYPFKLRTMTIFPLVGVEYDLNISHPSSGGSFEGFLVTNPTNSDYNQLWIKGGVGADLSLGGHLYVRPEALYGFKPLNADEQSVVNALKSAGYSTVSLGFNTFDLSVLFGYTL